MTRRLRILLPPLALLLAAACTPVAPPAGPAPAAAPARPPAERLAAALDSVFSDTAFERAHWGVLVRSLDRGEVLYGRNSQRRFVPASNMKILTGAAALEVLGPAHRFRTAVAATGPLRGGVLQGDLVILGGGDPALSERFFGTPTAVLEAWADSLARLGVRRVEGRVVGHGGDFADAPLGRGWSWDDVDAYYAAEVSGLEWNEGAIDVRAAPGARPGDPAVVTFAAPVPGLPLENRAVTGPAGSPARLVFRKLPLGVSVSGTIPAGGEAVSEGVAVGDPALAFASVLRETLRARGIEVSGAAVVLPSLRGADSAAAARPRPLFTHGSPPLSEVLAGFLKPSQNQMGEMLLRSLGRERRGEGSAEAGVAVIDSLMGAWGLDRRALAQADGSGLSRYNLVAPELLAGVLERMERGPHREVWRAALPVMGTDGTLAARGRGGPLQGRVAAKTGTLTGVRALSGYLQTADGERIVFSTIVNHHTLSARDADRVVDAALLRIAAFSRGIAAPE